MCGVVVWISEPIEFLGGVVKPLALASPAIVCLCLLERFGPCFGRRPALFSQIKGIAFGLVGVCIGSLLLWPALRYLPNPKPHWPLLAIPLAFLLGDFLQYWEHRAEHALFWRFHSVHHSSRDLCAGANFHHFSQSVFMMVIYGLPMAFITRDPGSITAVAVLLKVQGFYVHSPIRLSFGPLRRVLNDNRFHRVHHSLEECHAGRNFGAVLTIWDTLFGTAFWPAADEWPSTGITEYGEVSSITDLICAPFRRIPTPVAQAIN